jgi:hypothetical protein
VRRNIRLLVVLLFIMMIFAGCDRSMSRKSYYVKEKSIREKDGNSSFLVVLVKNPGIWSSYSYADPTLPKVILEVEADVFDRIQEKEFYFPEELESKFHITIFMLGLTTKDDEPNETKDQFRILNWRIEKMNKERVFVAVIVRKRDGGNDTDDTNTRIRVRIDLESYLTINEELRNYEGIKYYSAAELEKYGIKIPVEDETKR